MTKSPSLAGAWSAAILDILEDEHRPRFPCARYVDDFVGFAREILGVDPDALDAADLGAARVLWFACSYGDPHERIEAMRLRAGRCLSCRELDPTALRIPKPCPHSSEIDAVLVARVAEVRR